jgi:hypothetical protein
MFKHFYRLQLLDFFELTAATAGALYVYQSVGWWDWEKSWVIGALAIAAIILWFATRLGKITPTAGLFLAAYAGALYGLSDLTPWIELFGYETIEDWRHILFEGHQPLTTWKQVITLVGVLTFLMAIPSLLLSSIWRGAATCIQIARRKIDSPMNPGEKANFGFQITLSVIFICTLALMVRPKEIRYVRSVRLPYLSQLANPNWSEPLVTSGLNSISSWTISEDGSRLLILFTDRRVLEVDSQTGAVLKTSSIACRDLFEQCFRGVSESGDLFSALHTPDFDMNGVDRREKIWHLGENRLLFCADVLANFPPLYEIFDLATGKLDARAQSLGLHGKIRAVSDNGRFAVVEDAGSADPFVLEFSVWDLKSLQRKAEPRISMLSDAQFAIDNAGAYAHVVRQFEYPIVPPKVGHADEHQSLQIYSLSNNGDLICEDLGSSSEWGRSIQWRNGEKIDLPVGGQDWRWMRRTRTALLDPFRGTIFLLQTDLWRRYELEEHRGLPVIHHLVDRSYRSRLIQFDLENRKLITLSIRPAYLESPSGSSAKFSGDGRYFCMMDEYDTGYIFHIFAIP